MKEEEDKPVIDGEDEINSDLDDPDEEDLDNEQEGVQEGDIVIALYEKVRINFSHVRHRATVLIVDSRSNESRTSGRLLLKMV